VSHSHHFFFFSSVFLLLLLLLHFFISSLLVLSFCNKKKKKTFYLFSSLLFSSLLFSSTTQHKQRKKNKTKEVFLGRDQGKTNPKEEEGTRDKGTGVKERGSPSFPPLVSIQGQPLENSLADRNGTSSSPMCQQ